MKAKLIDLKIIIVASFIISGTPAAGRLPAVSIFTVWLLGILSNRAKWCYCDK